MARSLGALTLDLIARIGGFESGLDKAGRVAKKRTSEIEKDFKKLAAGAAAAGVAAAVGIGALVDRAIDAADSLNDLKKVTGSSTEFLSQIGYIAKQSGTDLESLTTGLRVLANTAADAAKGAKGPVAALDAIGVSAVGLDGTLRSTEDLLIDIAEKFSQFEDGLAKSALAQDLFGKSSGQLIPLLNEGRDGIEALRKEADALGLTISGTTAAAADQFNDTLSRLGAQADGFGNQLAVDMLPTLQLVADAIANTSDESVSFGKAISTVVSGGLKGLVDVGSRVVETFEDVGGALVALSAAAVKAAQGEFSLAGEIIRLANEDGLKREEEFTEFRKKLWEEQGDAIVETAKRVDAEVKKTLTFGGGEGEAAKIAAPTFDIRPIEDFYAELDSLTQTNQERQLAAYNEQREALEVLYASATISAEQYAARSAEAFDAVFQEVETTAKRIVEATDKAIGDGDRFAKQLNDGIFSALEDGIYTGITQGGKKGWDGFLEAGLDTINRLVAAALAKRLAEGLFGDDDKNTSGSTGSSILGSIIGGFFGGGRATGGPVNAGTLYRINEREPEYFRPNTGGEVIPLSKMSRGGGVNVHQTIQVTGRVDQRTAGQIAREATRQQKLAARLT